MRSSSRLKLFGPGLKTALQALHEFSVEFEGGNTQESLHTSKPNGTLASLSRYIRRGEDVKGDYDFLFHWHEEPFTDEIISLIDKIDVLLEPIGCRYSISTIGAHEEELPTQFSDEIEEILSETGETIITYLEFIGPSIGKALEVCREFVSASPSIKDGTLGTGFVAIGDADYAIQWAHPPTPDEIKGLLGELDEVLTPTGVLFKATTHTKKEKRPRMGRPRLPTETTRAVGHSYQLLNK